MQVLSCFTVFRTLWCCFRAAWGKTETKSIRGQDKIFGNTLRQKSGMYINSIFFKISCSEVDLKSTWCGCIGPPNPSFTVSQSCHGDPVKGIMSPGKFGRVHRHVLFGRTSQRWNGASNKLAATLPHRQDKSDDFFISPTGLIYKT